jgi:predicted Rossmann fold flavoprotein
MSDMKKTYNQIILGGGASGLMLASLFDDKVGTILLEGNPSVGAKISISGGGRCNLTNARVSSDDYRPNSTFTQSALSSFDSSSVVRWFEARGLHPVLQKRDQYFCPKSAREVLDVFHVAMREVVQETSCHVEKVEERNEGFVITTNRGVFVTTRLIVASGGLSYPRLGASDIGHRIAKQFGHTIVPPRPALVGLTLQPEQFFFKTLSGVATEVVITVGEHRIHDRILFAHKGISGPAVLDASLYWKKGEIVIDFIPGIDWKVLQRSSKRLSTILPLSKRLAKAFLIHLEVEDQPAAQLSDEERNRLKRLSAYRFAPAGTFGYTKAEVTCGGVNTDEINPQSMESRLHPGLFFVGEVLDVTGRLGGYNFQWAFSSAHACARAIER